LGNGTGVEKADESFEDVGEESRCRVSLNTVPGPSPSMKAKDRFTPTPRADMIDRRGPEGESGFGSEGTGAEQRDS